ncbi:AraC family transcriptional regulator [Sphingobium indicum]|uniref:AraC family transcriptional regulator n=1 Tax=Sphingobium indicum TaxID=332055 RepID=UPI0002D3F384|nr:AraC family transcriptional regulator [Sphingobium indicum]NYI23971.1 AraC-like DNA-binding protein [Sphingobium indicum]
MIRMPNTSINLPNPPSADRVSRDGQVLRWPLAQAEKRVPSALHAAVAAHIDAQGGGEGRFPTRLAGMHIMRSFEARMPMRQVYRPGLCVVIQGAKEILFGEETFRYGVMECLAIGLDLPASGRVIEASADAPYIGITIDLDMTIMREVLGQLETPPVPTSGSGPCLFVGKVDAPLADCMLRLLRMSDTPEAIPILYPSVMRELCYWLLTSPNGGELRNLGLPESSSERVSRAIFQLQNSFAQTLRVEQLAETARMSPSSFHQHFKALTSMTPLQYQKQLRLLEARRLMVVDGINVSEAAYQVGYESASQFSREYTRMFGAAPKRDVLDMRRQYSRYASRTLQEA